MGGDHKVWRLGKSEAAGASQALVPAKPPLPVDFTCLFKTA